MTAPKRFTRRECLKYLALTGSGVLLAACAETKSPVASPTAPLKNVEPTSTPPTQQPPTALPPSPTPTAVPPSPTPLPPTPIQVSPTPSFTATPKVGEAHLAVARGADPEKITAAAIKAIGGMEKFVKPGNDVVIKPNICIDYYDESVMYKYAATTNPIVVATLVKLALQAGAKQVRVFDHPFGGSVESAYTKSGIKKAVEQAGGKMEGMPNYKFKKFDIPQGKDIKNWVFFSEIFNTDVIINVPIAKHHNLAKLTLSGKNLLGVVSAPGNIHANMGQRVADLLSVVKPKLTVIDAVRILTAGGPTGGNLNAVKQTNTVIASHDPVAADAYATTLFELKGVQMKPEDIDYIVASAKMGLGTMDLKSIKIEEISVA